MPARRRELKPDSKGRYRPYLGFRVDAEGTLFNPSKDLGHIGHAAYATVGSQGRRCHEQAVRVALQALLAGRLASG